MLIISRARVRKQIQECRKRPDLFDPRPLKDLITKGGADPLLPLGVVGLHVIEDHDGGGGADLEEGEGATCTPSYLH